MTKMTMKYALLSLTLCLVGCTHGAEVQRCQMTCKPYFFVGFDQFGECNCSPVEIECKAKSK